LFYNDEQRGGIEFQNDFKEEQRIRQNDSKQNRKRIAKQVPIQSDSEKSIGLVSIRFE